MRTFRFKYMGLLLIILLCCFSCSNEDYDPRVDAIAELEELQIKNGGISGNIVYDGVLDQKNKTIVFEDVAAETNLLKIKFTGKISPGAAPEFEEYNFLDQNPQIVRIINKKAVTEYTVTLQINEPKVDPILERVLVTLEDGVTEVAGTLNHELKTLEMDAKNGEKVYLKSATALPAYSKIEFTKIIGSTITTADPGVVKLDFMGRKSEYKIIFTYIAPTGVDFKKAKEYRFADIKVSENPEVANGIYAANRITSADFDGDYLFLPVRANTAGGDNSNLGPIALSLNNIIANNPSYEMLKVDYTGSGIGPWMVMNGAVVNGHYYAMNTPYIGTEDWGAAGTMQYWSSKTAEGTSFQAVARDQSQGAGVVYGHTVNHNIDKNGNGYMFFVRGDGVNFVRAKVTNYNQFSDQQYISFAGASPRGAYNNFYPVGSYSDANGVTYVDEYTYISTAGLMLFTKDGGNGQNPIPANMLSAVYCSRVINYNDARYLVTLTGGGTNDVKLNVYDISGGDTTLDGLKAFANDETIRTAKYTYSLGSYASGGGASLAWSVKNDKLYVMGSAGKAGFVMVELPKNED